MKVLITGGTGYIVSHTCVTLAQAGYELAIFDDLYDSEQT
jgi:UDP-glucose 4-epimerase